MDECTALPLVKMFKAPLGVILIILLDASKCHMMGSILDAICALGVKVEHTPRGYTGLFQQMNERISKLLKVRIYNKWVE